MIVVRTKRRRRLESVSAHLCLSAGPPPPITYRNQILYAFIFPQNILYLLPIVSYLIW
jgi:hypothetical protein